MRVCGRVPERVLVVVRRSDTVEASFCRGPERGEVGARLGEAEVVVRSATDHCGVVVVLAVVLPEADRADLVLAPGVEGQVAAAGARVGAVARW